MKEPLTERQQQVLDFVRAYRRQHDISPSIRDIGNHLGISGQATTDLIERMERRGWITRSKDSARTRARKISIVGETIGDLYATIGKMVEADAHQRLKRAAAGRR